VLDSGVNSHVLRDTGFDGQKSEKPHLPEPKEAVDEGKLVGSSASASRCKCVEHGSCAKRKLGVRRDSYIELFHGRTIATKRALNTI
jgi:hypothetical protein